MSNPAYRFSIPLATQPADGAGRRWFVKEAIDAADGGPDLRAELLARALLSSGGVAIRPASLDLAGAIATVTGPVLAISSDGLAPVVLDLEGAGVALDLDAAGGALGDGVHAIVLRATPVTTSVGFTTPEIAVRDPQGNIVETTDPAGVTYALFERFGVLAIIDGETPAPDEVVVARVTKTGSAWSALEDAGPPPRLRARLEDLEDVDTTARADGFLLAWDEGTGTHVYVDPDTVGAGS